MYCNIYLCMYSTYLWDAGQVASIYAELGALAQAELDLAATPQLWQSTGTLFSAAPRHPHGTPYRQVYMVLLNDGVHFHVFFFAVVSPRAIPESPNSNTSYVARHCCSLQIVVRCTQCSMRKVCFFYILQTTHERHIQTYSSSCLPKL